MRKISTLDNFQRIVRMKDPKGSWLNLHELLGLQQEFLEGTPLVSVQFSQLKAPVCNKNYPVSAVLRILPVKSRQTNKKSSKQRYYLCCLMPAVIGIKK